MRRRRRALGALVVGLAGVLPATAAAAADPADALLTTWDGPTVNLAWDGSTYATSTTSFSGTPVAVPGDAQGRTITVTNDGPGDATLRGWVRDVVLLDAGAPDVHHATGQLLGDFYADLTLAWRSASGDGSASFRQLAAAGTTPVVEVPLARGASTRLTVVTSLPVTATSGNRANVSAREASYDVVLRLDGRDATPTPGPTAGPSDGGTGTPGGGSGVGGAGGDGAGGDRGDAAAAGPDGAVPPRSAALALTGLDVLRAGLLALVGIGAGSLLLGAARRRREVQNPGTSGSAPSAG